jgi:hypothetical protein
MEDQHKQPDPAVLWVFLYWLWGIGAFVSVAVGVYAEYFAVSIGALSIFLAARSANWIAARRTKRPPDLP